MRYVDFQGLFKIGSRNVFTKTEFFTVRLLFVSVGCGVFSKSAHEMFWPKPNFLLLFVSVGCHLRRLTVYSDFKIPDILKKTAEENFGNTYQVKHCSQQKDIISFLQLFSELQCGENSTLSPQNNHSHENRILNNFNDFVFLKNIRNNEYNSEPPSSVFFLRFWK